MLVDALLPATGRNAALLLFVGIISLALGLIYRNQRRIDEGLLPPEPTGPWPTKYPHRQWAEWMKEYGPMLTMRKGRDTTVIIGDYNAALEILIKQGASTIDRPHFIAANEILARNTRILTMSSNPNLRKYRKILHNYLSPKAVKTFAPYQLKNARDLIFNFIAEPDRHQHHAFTYASTVILALTYGKLTPTEYTDPEVKQTHRSRNRLFSAMRPGPGAYMVEKFPFLKHIPGYAMDLKRLRKQELRDLNEPVDLVRKALAVGQAPPSLAKYMLEKQKEYELNDEDIMSLAGAMFGAGSYTTAVHISTTVMAAVLYPELQAKIHEELDAVVGRHQAPTFEFEGQLPQTEAFILEVARWWPVLPGGFPHRVSKEMIWKNYRIPAGTLVQGSHWSIGRDPNVFPDPEKFNPQRWITEKGTIRTDIDSFPYGYGRRICPGQHLANRSLFLTTALLFWSFRIEEVDVLDPFAFTDEMNPQPLPFKVNFKLRHDKAALESMLGQFGQDGGQMDEWYKVQEKNPMTWGLKGEQA